eukprot:COSAG01_NODE_1491_length_10131_cov_5.872508_5_plen_112_part_00
MGQCASATSGRDDHATTQRRAAAGCGTEGYVRCLAARPACGGGPRRRGCGARDAMRGGGRRRGCVVRLAAARGSGYAVWANVECEMHVAMSDPTSTHASDRIPRWMVRYSN